MAGEAILIVDDNPANLKLARVLLSGAGYDVRTASDGIAALGALESFTPALILMDLQMPGIDGLELTRRLKSDPRTREIIVLALTAYAMIGDSDRARLAGCDGYIAKPIDTRSLPSVIAGYIARGRTSEGEISIDQVAAPPTDAGPPAPKRVSLLVIEDNPITRKMIRVALESEGYEIFDAGDGERALQIARAHLPSLVVSDYVLPDANGLQILEELRRIPGAHELPGILVSGMISRLHDFEALGGSLTTVLPKPVEPSRLVEHVRSRLSRAESVGQGRRILFVDDDPLNRKLGGLCLRQAGFQVTLAADADEALRVASSTRPDAILSDILMPVTDGFQLCLAIRANARLHDIPVVLLSSAYVEEADLRLAHEMGAHAFLPRSANYSEVISALVQVFGGTLKAPPRPEIDRIEQSYHLRIRQQLERQTALNQTLQRQGAIQAAALSVIRGITEALSTPTNVPGTLGDILVHSLDASGLSVGVLYLADQTGRLTLRAQAGLNLEERDRAEYFFGHREAIDAAMARAEPTAFGEGALFTNRSVLIVPLGAAGRVQGVLLIASEGHDLESPTWHSFGRALAGQFGQAVALGETMSRLAASEERYRSLFERSVQGIFRCDADGKFTVANPAFASMLGFDSADELLRSSIDIAGTCADPRLGTSLMQSLSGEGAVEALELEAQRNDGRLAYLRTTIRLASTGEERARSYEGFVEDITDRTIGEIALQESRSRLEHVLTSSPTVAFTLLKTNGEYLPTWVSENIERVTGFTAEQALRPGWWIEHVHPEDSSRVIEAVQQGAPSVEYRFRANDGRILRIRSEFRFLATTDSVEIVGSWSDVTAQRELEDRLRQSEKLEALGQMTGGIAHDFSNILEVFTMASALLFKGLPEDHPLHRHVHEIAIAAERGGALTRQLLAFSRRQPLTTRVLDLNDAVASVSEILQRLIGTQVSLELKTTSEPALIRIDRTQLEQIIFNLAANARDAMPRGGRLIIESAPARAFDAIAAPRVRLSVTDTGEGMTSEVASRIFEPFFTTKAIGKGTGIGLATVYGIVKQAGGEIDVHSERGRGTTFHLDFPQVEGHSDEQVESRADLGIPTGSETILLVEDNELVREVIRESLGSLGYEVLEASDGEEAIEVAARTGEIQLLATDLIMPTMRGGVLAEMLRKSRPGMRLLFMSGFPPEFAQAEGAIPPDAGFLQKPFALGDLARIVRRLLDARSPA